MATDHHLSVLNRPFLALAGPAVLFLLLSFLGSGKKTKIWLIGDSTMANKEIKAFPETGWGMPFATLFDSSVVIDNRAKNGRSTRSFIAEGLWKSVLDNLQPGDYVFIQFGHNDEGKDKVGRYTTPDEFRANLLRYVSEARTKGAIPVLLTPVGRRNFDAEGQPMESHPVYADAVREVAATNHVPLIDLDERSKALLHAFGPDDSRALYNYLQPGENPNYPEGHRDDTHFNELGARKTAEIVLLGIRELLPALAAHIRGPLAPPQQFTVAADGSGKYRTVQAALDAVPPGNSKEIIIYIKKGIYTEKLHLDSTRNHVTLVGEDAATTILTYNDHPGMVAPNGDSINTRNSHSFLAQGADFSARRLTFRNDAGFTAGQAVALEVQGDRASFFDCRIIGNQDILFLNNPDSRQYYRDCYLEGTTDFIFGDATAWFENCHIYSKKNSHVTAASTPQEHPYGFIFYHCVLGGDSAITNASLGRPWRPFASVTYIHCYIGGHIRREGWSAWNNLDSYKTSRFGEYDDYGPGAVGPGKGLLSRVAWSHQLTDDEVQKITLKQIFNDWYPEILYW
jgi:pectinesterase